MGGGGARTFRKIKVNSMIKLGASGRSKAFQILLDITTILRYSMVWPLRIEKHSIWTEKYLPILGHILILGCRIAMRDLWRKVHDHAQFFVLCIHTFQLVSSSVRSKQLLCFVHGQGQKREQKHATKNSINCYCHVLSNACWFSCCSLRAGSHGCSFSFSAKKSSWWFVGNTSCQKALCECDGAAARCYQKYDSQFQDQYKNYDKSSC